MNINKSNGVIYYTFNSFEKAGFIKHAFSTREGGVSEGIYSSMNLSFYTEDKKENIISNYEIFCKSLGINPQNLVLSAQTHSDNVMAAGEDDRGNGIFSKNKWDGVDGLITDTPDVFLVTLYADCIPLFFADPVKKTVGVAHAGWKGTRSGIAGNTVIKMKEEFGCNPEDIIAGIGPGIERDCFEMGEKEADEFLKMPEKLTRGMIVKRKTSGEKFGYKYYIDLPGINKNIILSEGVKDENIELSGICTLCNNATLFSHRGGKGKRGGMAAIIGIEK